MQIVCITNKQSEDFSTLLCHNFDHHTSFLKGINFSQVFSLCFSHPFNVLMLCFIFFKNIVLVSVITFNLLYF